MAAAKLSCHPSRGVFGAVFCHTSMMGACFRDQAQPRRAHAPQTGPPDPIAGSDTRPRSSGAWRTRARRVGR